MERNTVVIISILVVCLLLAGGLGAAEFSRGRLKDRLDNCIREKEILSGERDMLNETVINQSAMLNETIQELHECEMFVEELETWIAENVCEECPPNECPDIPENSGNASVYQIWGWNLTDGFTTNWVPVWEGYKVHGWFTIEDNETLLFHEFIVGNVSGYPIIVS